MTSGEKYYVVVKTHFENCITVRNARLCLHGSSVSYFIDTPSHFFNLLPVNMLILLIKKKEKSSDCTCGHSQILNSQISLATWY